VYLILRLQQKKGVWDFYNRFVHLKEMLKRNTTHKPNADMNKAQYQEYTGELTQ